MGSGDGADDDTATPAGDEFTVPPAETPGDHEFAVVNGVRLHYVVAGPEDGQLVVLLHGFPECWYSWQEVIPALADAGYRVVAPDMRGYNRSEKPRGVRAYDVEHLVGDVVALVGHLDRERAAVVGHDWGGGVAWQLAIRHPDLVEKVAVLNSPHPKTLERELTGSLEQLRKSWYLFYFQVPWLPERVLTSRRLGVLEDVFEGAHEESFTETDVDRLTAAFRRPGVATSAINYYRALFRTALRQLLRGEETEGDVLVPTMVVWGEEDAALSLDMLDGLEEWVPDLRVERLPDATHWVHHDEPERVRALLVDFLARG